MSIFGNVPYSTLSQITSLTVFIVKPLRSLTRCVSESDFFHKNGSIFPFYSHCIITSFPPGEPQERRPPAGGTFLKPLTAGSAAGLTGPENRGRTPSLLGWVSSPEAWHGYDRSPKNSQDVSFCSRFLSLCFSHYSNRPT